MRSAVDEIPAVDSENVQPERKLAGRIRRDVSLARAQTDSSPRALDGDQLEPFDERSRR